MVVVNAYETFVVSKGGLEDKILVPKPPQNCATCGDPVDGLYGSVVKEIPICYDDDEDYTIAITPVLSTNEPVDSLIMEGEHLDTIPATESDEVIKSSVENLVQILSEFEGISEDTCDVPVCEDPSIFDALSNHSEIISDSNNDGTSSDDDSYENIEYVSLEEVNNDQEEKEFDLEDIFQIQDVFLREKLLNISLIRSLRSPILLSLIQITLYLNSRLLAIIRKRQEVAVPLLMLITLFPSMIHFFFKPDAPVINNFDELNEGEYFNPGGGEIDFSQNVKDDDSFTFIIRTFLPYFTYPVDSPLPLSTGSEDTIFDPGIST
ncbi:hypothetical protein Tco_0740047 [Tanacetum coccineum]